MGKAARQPNSYTESAEAARDGAEAAKVARQQLEKSTGKRVVSRLNAKNLGQKNIESSVNINEVE